MKKYAAFVIVPLFFSLIGCAFIDYLTQAPDKITETWQTVIISGIGTFRVPEEWNIEQQDGILYITDKPLDDNDYSIYLVGVVTTVDAGIRMETKHSRPHEIFEGVEKVGVRSSPFWSRKGAGLSLNEYTINGITEERYLIDLHNFGSGVRNDFEMLAWNQDFVGGYIAEQIVRTFAPAGDYFDSPNVGRLVS
jgi:hypothetical protein